MLRNYYLTAIRNLWKHKSYFLLNLSGLAIGIASFVFIGLYIINELSYDKMHSEYKNMYRMHVKGLMMGQDMDLAHTPAPLSKALLEEFPEVKNITRIKESGAWIIGHEAKKFNEDGVLFADSTFFDVFDFPLIAGNPKTALAKPRSMVLTRSIAQKYFGDENPLGKKITVEQDTIFYEVTGLMEDIPDNSHLQFDMLGSISTYPRWLNQHWFSNNFYTYFTLNDQADPSEFESKLPDLLVKYIAPLIQKFLGISLESWEQSGNTYGYYIMPLADIHLHSHTQDERQPNSDISYIYIYSLIAIILLFIAIINFINLATAQSSSRAKEVGIRKVAGSTKLSLVYQFILESIIIALLASLAAYILVVFSAPAFTALIGKQLSVDVTSNVWVWLSMFGLAIIIGVLAGFYPAFVLAAYEPAHVLNGTLRKGAKSGWLRNLLVVIQFTASIVIIIGTVVVYKQTDYMVNKNLGFDKEQILMIRRPDVLKNNLETFKHQLSTNSNIKSIANAMSIPGKTRYNNNAYFMEDHPESPYTLYENVVSFDYGETMGLELVKGRFFSRDYVSDSSAVVINESAVKLLGYGDEALGKRFIDKDDKGNVDYMTIIGVVKDFHFESLHKPISPYIMRFMPSNWEGYACIRLGNTQNLRETIDFIENTWYEHSNNKPFQYFFFDEDYENLYKSESTTGKVFLVFACLSIFIACLGLIGLITYTLSIRRKEIGIRKVLGASTTSMVRLLSNEMVKLIAIATIIGWPLAYFATDYWLQNFASRLPINFSIYLVSTIIVFVIGGLAISIQTFRASRANPVESLRQE